MTSDFDLERVLESKRAYRRDLRSRPIGEKLAMLDALRDRARTIRKAAVRLESTVSPYENPDEPAPGIQSEKTPSIY